MTKNIYLAFKEKKQKDINNFPMFFAFSKKQFNEGMSKLGLSPEELDKILSVWSGGYILKKDSEKLDNLLDKHHKQFKELLKDDNFIYAMFSYELYNHEYCITYDITDTINALGLTKKEIDENPKLKAVLKKAIKEQKENW